MDPRQFVRFIPDLDGMPVREAVPRLAEKSGESEEAARDLLWAWESWGLISAVSDQERVEVEKGTAQFLWSPDEFSEDVLGFLPQIIHCLWARKALLQAGSELVDQLRRELVEQDPEMPTLRRLVPLPFRGRLSRAFSLNMFAAAVSLMSNLINSSPAATVAEQISAVALVERAGEILKEWVDIGLIGSEDCQVALDDLPGLIEFLDQSDPMILFSDDQSYQLRDPDWLFAPLSWVPMTGYFLPARA